jgi:hypothetical protein
LFTVPQDKNGRLFLEESTELAAKNLNGGTHDSTHVDATFNETMGREHEPRLPDVAGPVVIPVEFPAEESTREAYTLVIGDILSVLQEPRSEKWLAVRMNVRTVQMKDWLDRAIREGRIKRLRKPVRYVADSHILFNS